MYFAINFGNNLNIINDAVTVLKLICATNPPQFKFTAQNAKNMGILLQNIGEGEQVMTSFL